MAVPDTNTFTLKDVTQEIYGDTNSGRSLRQSFDDSNPDGFDDNYVPSGFDPHATDKSGYKLSYFRNYDDNPLYMEVDPNSYNADADGDSFTLSIDCPDDENWTVSTSDTWITAGTSSGTGPEDITITVGINKDTEEGRSGEVDVYLDVSETIRDTCEINQSPATT